MAFGKSKAQQSYGVPVRSAVPLAGPEQAVHAEQVPAATLSWAPAPAQPGGFYAPVVAAHVPMGAQFTASSAYAPAPPNAYAQTEWSPAPAGYAPTPYGQQGWAPSPAGFGPPPPNNTGRNVIIAVAVVVGAIFVIGILAAIAIPVFLNQRGALKSPASLGGRTLATDPTAKALSASITAEMKKRNGGRSAIATYYVDSSGKIDVALIAIRGRTEEDRDVRDASAGGFAIDTSSRQSFGTISCYPAARATMSACFWQDGVSGIIIALRSSDLQETAAIAKEAQAALN